MALLTLFRHDERQRHRSCQILAAIQMYFAKMRFRAKIDWQVNLTSNGYRR